MKKWFRENKKYGYLLVFILAVLFLVGSLFDFSMLVMRHETNQGYENLRYTNEQHSLIVQNQIDQYFVALIKDALLLSKQELTDQETCLEFFERLMELPDMDFGVFGIADLEGNTFLSRGEKDSGEGQAVLQGGGAAGCAGAGKESASLWGAGAHCGTVCAVSDSLLYNRPRHSGQGLAGRPQWPGAGRVLSDGHCHGGRFRHCPAGAKRRVCRGGGGDAVFPDRRAV